MRMQCALPGNTCCTDRFYREQARSHIGVLSYTKSTGNGDQLWEPACVGASLLAIGCTAAVIHERANSNSFSRHAALAGNAKKNSFNNDSRAG